MNKTLLLTLSLTFCLILSSNAVESKGSEKRYFIYNVTPLGFYDVCVNNKHGKSLGCASSFNALIATTNDFPITIPGGGGCVDQPCDLKLKTPGCYNVITSNASQATSFPVPCPFN